MKREVFFVLTAVCCCLAIRCNYSDDNVTICLDPDCVDTEPTVGQLYIELTLNQTNQTVPIVIYEGDFDDVQNHVIVLYDTLTASAVVYDLPISDTKYSATALYLRSNGDTVLVVDDDRVGDDYDSDCDCYIVDNGHLDLKLRFPKQSVKTSQRRGIEVFRN